MRIVVVTGATGFIGRHLVEALSAQRVEVRLFDPRKHSLQDKNSLIGLVRGSNLVFHLAAKNFPDDPELWEVNLLGTANLLEAIIETAPLAKFVFPSSFAVYRVPKRGEVINEGFETLPMNRYGLSKLLAEEIIKFYSRTKRLRAVILRISNSFGPGDRVGRSVVANFVKALKGGERITIYGDGSQTRDFVYVRDVTDSLLKSAEYEFENAPVINICSGREKSLNKLLRTLESISGRKSVVAYKREGGAGGGFWRGDNSSAGKLLSWFPKTSLEEGLRKTWEGV